MEKREMGSEQNDSAPDVHEPMKNEEDKGDLNQDESVMIPLVRHPLANSKNNEDKPNDLHNSPTIYKQDVVRHKDTGVIGIVSEVAGESDSDSSITDDEDDDDGDDEDEDGGADGHSNTDGGGDRNRGGDSDDNDSLQADHVRVNWMGGPEPIQDIHNVTLVDRAFLHGDYVASALDPTGQIGVVVDVNISADLLALDGSIMKNVSSRNLNRVRDYAVGDYVILGPWLGRVDDVLDNVTVLFDDGSQCKVTKAEPTRLKPVSKTNFEDDGHFPYYPGQRVRGNSSSVFKNSRWLSGLWKANRSEGTVTKVTAGSVFVYWIASAAYGPHSSTSPAEEQSPKNLRLLSCLTHANWQVGDWCLLPQPSSSTTDNNLSKLGIQDSVKSELDYSQPESGCDSEGTAADELVGNGECMDLDPVVGADVSKNTENSISLESSSRASPVSVPKEPIHETCRHPRKKIRKVVLRRDKKARKNEEIFEKALLIVNTRTKVDVAWQDGVVEHGIESTTLIPIDDPGDHEFFAEQYVVEKASDDNDDDAGEARRVGVVKSVDAKEKTSCVRWLKPVARAEDPREFDKEEIVSVYELEGHPDYDYCYGDVVVRLSPVTVSPQTVSAVESEEQNAPNEVKQDGEVSLGHKETENTSESCMNFSDLTWAGNITGLTNGDIEVTWADGMISMVGPQAIYVVGRDDDDESVAAGSEVSDAVSWETVNDDEMYALENTSEEFGTGNPSNMNPEVEESVENNSGRRVPFSLPVTSAIGLVTKVTRLASGIFSWGQRNVDDAALEQPMNVSPYDESSSQESNVIGNCVVENTPGQREEATESAIVEEALSCSKAAELNASAYRKGEASSFKRFDIVKDPLDHNFLGSNGQVSNSRKWLKQVQKDWSILQNNLPDGIYVRVYEDRMDLIRAVIVGAYGTPYQDGLFFFDFHLPPEYPDVPPSLYYHSGGWRINPNLYEEGKVCLSLLNTWTGKGNEVWDSASSSILQVLVSLQGLVLNARPYFNEAGYDKQIGTAEGEKNSLFYNENTFLLNCKTMMYLMRRTPKDFEELVKDHFRRRGYYILKACDAYMKGHLIGSLATDASISNDDHTNSTSAGFKLGLKKILPKLYSALTEAGAECNDFAHWQQS